MALALVESVNEKRQSERHAPNAEPNIQRRGNLLEPKWLQSQSIEQIYLNLKGILLM
jgi:hypothetical protein